MAKLYSDDEIFIAGDKFRTDLCIVCLRLMAMSHKLCTAVTGVSFACDHIFDTVLILICCFVDFNLVVSVPFRWLSTNILGCSIIVLIIGLPDYSTLLVAPVLLYFALLYLPHSLFLFYLSIFWISFFLLLDNFHQTEIINKSCK